MVLRNVYKQLPIGDDPLWYDGIGFAIPLSQINDDHLLNIERMLLGRGNIDPSARQDLFNNWYDVIRNEVERRSLKLLDEDHPRAKLRQEG